MGFIPFPKAIYLSRKGTYACRFVLVPNIKLLGSPKVPTLLASHLRRSVKN